MTKKHFKDMAARLQSLRPNADDYQNKVEWSIARALWQHTVREMTSFCAMHSKNFDREKFMDACGYNGR